MKNDKNTVIPSRNIPDFYENKSIFKKSADETNNNQFAMMPTFKKRQRFVQDEEDDET